MGRMKKTVFSLLLCSLILLESCSGEKDGQTGNSEMQNEERQNSDIMSDTGDSEVQEEEIVLHEGDWLTSAGDIERTWVKDYDSSEWEDSACLHMYVHQPLASNSHIPMIEDEMNHRLHMAGYDFHVHFELCSVDEFWSSGESVDELVGKREDEEGITIDMYLTDDYRSAVQNGKILELTDYLSDQEELYGYYDENVWGQLTDQEGRIYGIPSNPIAASKLGYAYNPQLAELLSIDMEEFDGDPALFEDQFPYMLENGIIPLNLNLESNDYLVLSLFGLETYEDIFAIRHDGEEWEAIDLWEEDIIDFYEQLGAWKEEGYLSYGEGIVQNFELQDTAVDRAQYRYCFLVIQNNDRISWAYDINMSDEGGYLETDLYIPDNTAYIYEKMNSEIMVINSATDYPEECKQFLNLLATDDELRLLLESGIENYHYVWKDEVQVFDPNGGGLILNFYQDLRFWPVEYFSEKYDAEIEAMNEHVEYAAALELSNDFSGMEATYGACKQIFDDNMLVFLGYYGEETGRRLEEVHELLIDAGYLELIDAINDVRGKE
ncbi:MAG: hypothetical protein ACI4SE_01760 [Lachnospiraceae bacterium]